MDSNTFGILKIIWILNWYLGLINFFFWYTSLGSISGAHGSASVPGVKASEKGFGEQVAWGTSHYWPFLPGVILSEVDRSHLKPASKSMRAAIMSRVSRHSYCYYKAEEVISANHAFSFPPPLSQGKGTGVGQGPFPGTFCPPSLPFPLPVCYFIILNLIRFQCTFLKI